MNREDRLKWLSELEEGDQVAIRNYGYGRSKWLTFTIDKITPTGRFNLSSSAYKVNPDGSVRGGNGYIEPVTEEVRVYIWRAMAIRIIRDMELEKLSDDDLSVLLNVARRQKETS